MQSQPESTIESSNNNWITKALSIEWLGQTIASLCWISSVFVYGSGLGDDWPLDLWLQLIAGGLLVRSKYFKSDEGLDRPSQTQPNCYQIQLIGELMQNPDTLQPKNHKVIIVGAGAAGLGVAVVLEKLGLEYLVLERDEIGASFRKWPAESCFISPSFVGNFFNMPDLNSITPETAPAFNLQTSTRRARSSPSILRLLRMRLS